MVERVTDVVGGPRGTDVDAHGPDDGSPDPVRRLLRLDREIRRAAAARRRGARVLVAILVVLALVVISTAPFLAEPGLPRRTVAALSSLLVVGGYVLAPVVTGRGALGLRPDHVRLLPVPAGPLVRAVALAHLRSPGSIGLLIGLLAAALGAAETVSGGIVAGGLAVLVAAATAVGARLAEIGMASTMRSPAGRVVVAVVAVITGGAGYLAFALIGQAAQAIGGNPVLQVALRVLPSGWPVAGAEAVGQGRWWLAAGAAVGIVGVTLLLALRWRGLVARMLEGAFEMSGGRRRRTTEPEGGAGAGAHEARARTTTTPALAVTVLAEASLLVRDPRRVGLLVLPVMFLVLGVGLMVTGLDVYGMQIGAPLVLLVASSPFTNGYGLDGPAAWRLVVVPGAGPRTIEARMVVAGVAAAAVAALGTVVARLVRDSDPGTLPVAVAVILAGAAGVAATSGVQSATAPYKVEASSIMGAMTARGSMTGAAFGWSLVTIVAIAATIAPGAVAAALLPGALGWLGVPVALAAGTAAVLLGRRLAIRLLTARGPEIFAVVG